MSLARFLLPGVPALIGLAAATMVCAESPPEGDAPAFEHTGHMHDHGLSAEHAAMRNLVVAALAVKTGRSQDDIAKVMEKTPPHEVGRQLGLDDDAMHAVFTNAHRTLIDRMQAARLITPDQADQLKSQPLPMHHERGDRGTHPAD